VSSKREILSLGSERLLLPIATNFYYGPSDYKIQKGFDLLALEDKFEKKQLIKLLTQSGLWRFKKYL
jgi:hypothetical protein